MKLRLFLLPLVGLIVPAARADLTVVQKVDVPGSTTNQITIYTKGDKMRIDTAPQVSTIVDGKTGEMITLMKDQKCALHISAEKMRAAAAMINKFADKPAGTEKPRPKPTGRKETINGYDTEEYVVDTGVVRASYWLAPKYPDGESILRQLQAVRPEMWSSANGQGTDFGDFPALPIRTVVDMGGTKMTTELVSVKEDPLTPAIFAIPADYREVKTPELANPGQPVSAPATSPR